MVRIREATQADLPLLVEFNCLLALESEGKKLDRDTVTRGVGRALSHPELCRYFVADEPSEGGGWRALGQTMVTFELTDWRDGVIYWVQSVYVATEARGKGVFAKLYEHVKAQALANDGRLLRLYVDRDNISAISVYERLGMERASYYLYEGSLEPRR